MTPCRNKILILHCNAVVFWCIPSLHLLYNICRTEYSLSSPFNHYFSILRWKSHLLSSYSSFPISFFFISLLRSFHQYLPIMKPVSTSGPASKFISDVIRASLVHFVEAVEMSKFQEVFNIRSFL